MYFSLLHYGGHVIQILKMPLPTFYQMDEMDTYNQSLISLFTLTNA